MYEPFFLIYFFSINESNQFRIFLPDDSDIVVQHFQLILDKSNFYRLQIKTKKWQ